MTDLIKVYDSAEEITKIIFSSYSDVITRNIISEHQVIIIIYNFNYVIGSKISQKNNGTSKEE